MKNYDVYRVYIADENNNIRQATYNDLDGVAAMWSKGLDRYEADTEFLEKNIVGVDAIARVWSYDLMTFTEIKHSDDCHIDELLNNLDEMGEEPETRDYNKYFDLYQYALVLEDNDWETVMERRLITFEIADDWREAFKNADISCQSPDILTENDNLKGF